MKSQGAGRRNGKPPTSFLSPTFSLQTGFSAGMSGSEGVQAFWESTLKLLRECAPGGDMIQDDHGDPGPACLRFPASAFQSCSGRFSKLRLLHTHSAASAPPPRFRASIATPP